jgi:membrane associated rhomboid family serine protease
MNNIINDIKDSFKAGNFLTKLIYINAGVFALVKIVLLVCNWFSISTFWLQYLEMPAFLPSLLRQPWSIITYMFLHTDFIHVIFNLIALYYFGRLFLQFFSQKQLVAVYIWGGIAGALVYIAGFATISHFAPFKLVSFLLGASASVMAILFAAVGYAPNSQVQVTLIGTVKLKYIGLAFLALDIIGLDGLNSGGSMAHIGGAVMGYLFAVCLQKGTDLSMPITRCIDWIVNNWPQNPFSKKGRFKVTVDNTQRMSDAQWNRKQKEQEKARQERVDLILEKIKKSGYNNLTDEEKKSLFDLSRNEQ